MNGKTRFDLVMENLAKEGKVHTISNEERTEIFKNLRRVLDDHRTDSSRQAQNSKEALAQVVLTD
jgi:hypothetical protein